eukprot:141583_1
MELNQPLLGTTVNDIPLNDISHKPQDIEINCSVEQYKSTIRKQYRESVTLVPRRNAYNIFNTWCYDTLKIISYTLGLIICCPCTCSVSIKTLLEIPSCKSDVYLCKLYCCTLECGEKAIRKDVYGLMIIFFISLLPFISLILYILSKFNIIHDDIQMNEAILPIISLLLFGRIYLYVWLSRNILKYVINVQPDSILFWKQNAWSHSSVAHNLHITNNTQPLLFTNGTQGDLKAFMSDEIHPKCKQITSVILAILYGCINIVYRAVTNQYKQCHYYCVYALVVAWFVNTSIVMHVIYSIGIYFFNIINEYKYLMNQLTDILIIGEPIEKFPDVSEEIVLQENSNMFAILLCDGDNINNWFNRWCAIKHNVSNAFHEFESILLACFM